MAERVLIVEDEENIVVSLEFLLGHEGYEVAVAGDGLQALSLAATFRPHLVLLDVMLPGLDGFEVCRRLRAGAPGADPPKIVMLTARGRDVERHHGLDVGADLYVTKPFSTRELIAEIRRCLDGRDA
jgi:DNA-binding response OmpR family regulator